MIFVNQFKVFQFLRGKDLFGYKLLQGGCIDRPVAFDGFSVDDIDANVYSMLMDYKNRENGNFLRYDYFGSFLQSFYVKR